MRKRILSILLCLVMVVGLFPTMAFAADGSGATSGSGTASDPYIVTTFEELKAELEKDTVGLGMLLHAARLMAKAPTTTHRQNG